jgi:hypothetical protein
MAPRIPFHFQFGVDVFHKADAEPGKQKRIGGIVSTETPDKQGEVVLQEGLDFGEFLNGGWFNDNHSKETTDVVGYPEMVRKFKRGEALPNGRRAGVNGTWVEGYLLNTEKGRRMWELGQALQSTNRRLGFSVEGKVERRAGPRTVFLKDPQSGQGQWVGREIVRATVRNVAVTNAPVQGDAKLEVLAKSMQALERQGEEEDKERLGKTLAMGPATPGQKPVGPKTGRGAGKVLTRQHLERTEHDLLKPSMKKSLSDGQAIRYVQTRIPGISYASAARIVQLTRVLKRQNRL